MPQLVRLDNSNSSVRSSSCGSSSDNETTSQSSSRDRADVFHALTSNSPPLLVPATRVGTSHHSQERLTTSIVQAQSDIVDVLHRRPTLEDLDALPRMYRDMYEKRQLLRELQTRAGCEEPLAFNQPLQAIHANSHHVANLKKTLSRPTESKSSNIPLVRPPTASMVQTRREGDAHSRYAATMAPLFSSITPSSQGSSPIQKLTALLRRVEPSSRIDAASSPSKRASRLAEDRDDQVIKSRDVLTDDAGVISKMSTNRQFSPTTYPPHTQLVAATRSTFLPRIALSLLLAMILAWLVRYPVWPYLTRNYLLPILQ